MLFKCFLCLIEIFNCFLLLLIGLLGLGLSWGSFVLKNLARVLLVVRGFLQFLSGLRDHFGHVLANKVGAIHKVGLGALHFLGFGGILLLGNLLGLLDNLFLSSFGLFNITNGLADDFLLVALGSEDACDVNHGTARATFVAGGTLEARALDIGKCAFEGRIEFGLHLFESKPGARFVGGIEQLVQLLEFLDERGGFITDAGLVKFLQPQVNLGALLVARRGGFVRHDHSAIHVVLLRAGEAHEPTGEFAENLLLLPIKVYLLKLHSHLLLA